MILPLILFVLMVHQPSQAYSLAIRVAETHADCEHAADEWKRRHPRDEAQCSAVMTGHVSAILPILG